MLKSYYLTIWIIYLFLCGYEGKIDSSWASEIETSSPSKKRPLIPQDTLLVSQEFLIHFKNEVISRSLDAAKADMRFQAFGEGEIVYIYGSSTSGKSTLCRAIGEKYPDIPLLSGRDYKNQYILSLVKKIFPSNYKAASSAMNDDAIVTYLYFGHFIYEGEFEGDLGLVEENVKYIKDNIFLVDRQYKSDELLALLFEKAVELSSAGQRVVIDNLDIDFFLRYLGSRNYKCPLRFVLLYCSPAHLLERVHIRNKAAEGRDKLDLRPVLRPLLTYAQLYKRRIMSSQPNQVLDVIGTNDLFSIYKQGYEIDKELALPLWVTEYSDKEKDMWPHLKAHVSRNFNMSRAGNEDSVEIVARFPFHMLINTQVSPPQELALKIISWDEK